MYSLWRSDVFLGNIVPELPGEEARSVFGVLQPTDAFLPGVSVHQFTALTWPGRQVWQQEIAAEANSGAASTHQVGIAGSQSLPEATRDCVPQSLQLILRDGKSQAVLTRSIMITRMGRRSRDIDNACQEAGVPSTGWLVIASIAAHGDGVL